MWENDPIVKELISYMEGKGCILTLFPGPNMDELHIKYGWREHVIIGEDIFNALHAAYRVEWEPLALRKRFERYLIDLNNKRRFNNENGI